MYDIFIITLYNLFVYQYFYRVPLFVLKYFGYRFTLYYLVIFSVVIELVSMTDNVPEEEVDRLAEAVLTLRRSGLFSVEPLETTTPGGLHGGQRGEFVTTRRRKTAATRFEPPDPAEPVTMTTPPMRQTQFLGPSTPAQECKLELTGHSTNPFRPADRGEPGTSAASLPSHTTNPFRLTVGFGTTPFRKIEAELPVHIESPYRLASPLIPPSSFCQKKSSTPASTFAPVFSNPVAEPIHMPSQMQTHHRSGGNNPFLPHNDGHSRPTQRFSSLQSDSMVYPRVPRISTFTGSTTKGEASGFEDWRFEVRCLMRDGTVNEDLILQGVRNSLKGEANRVAMHLGENATLGDIIVKLERTYGTVESGTTLLQQFYNCKQEETETIGAYSCRLEDVLNKAIARGAVSMRQSDDMLRSKLWSGLKDERVRNATRYKLDQIQRFDELVGELRAAEQEIKELEGVRTAKAKPNRVMYAPQTKGSDEEQHSKTVIDELSRKVKHLEDGLAKQSETNKTLNKILERIESLERESKASNCKGPLSRDSQKSTQRQQTK